MEIDAETSPGAGGARIAFAALVLYAVLHAVFLLIASRSASALLWGVDHGSVLPAPALLFLFPFAAAGWAEILRRRGGGGFFRAKTFSALLLASIVPAAALLFFFFRDPTHLLGDGMLIVNRTVQGMLFTESSPLANRIALWASSFSTGDVAGVEHSLSMLSAGAGVVFTILALLLWKRLEGAFAPAAAGLLLFLVQPLLLVFCGYIEFYSISLVFSLGLVLACLLAMEGRVPPVLPVALFILTVATHFLTIIYAPIVASALAATLGGKRKGGKAGRAIVAVLIGAAAGAVLLFLARVDPVNLFLNKRQHVLLLHRSVQDAAREAYALFDSAHFIDLLNETLLVMPLLPVLPLLLYLAGKEGRDRFVLLLTACAGAALIPFFLLNPELGFARDWDLMAFGALPANLAAAILLVRIARRRFSDAPSRGWSRALIVFLVALGITRTAAWLVLNLSSPLAVERARAIAGEARLNAPFSRSYLHENLSRLLGDRGEAADAFVEATLAEKLRPDHPRLANRTGVYARDAGKTLAAEAAFHRAIALDSLYTEAWMNLGTLHVSEGKMARAESDFRAACRASPEKIESRLMLALAVLFQDRPGEALAVAMPIARAGASEDRSRALSRLDLAFESAGYADEARRLRAARGGR